MMRYLQDWLGVIIQLATLITLFYTLGKFMAKPNATQNDRISALESWRDKVNRRLKDGEDHFSDIDESNRVTQKALIAILGHDISGNNEAELKEARQELNDLLIKK